MKVFNPFGARVAFIFAWYDLWVGAYYDRKNHLLYVLPVPTLGIVIDLNRGIT